jgi:exopolysaccharide biosynthesis polyprenyl glycosylphosphotransferase
VLRSAFITFMLAIAVSFLIQRHMSRLLIVISGMVAVTLLIVQKQTASRFINDLHIKGFGMKRVALYGAGETGKRIFSALQRSPKVGLLPVVCFDTDSALTDDRLYEAGYRRQFSIPILTCEPTAVLLREQDVEMLIVTIPSLSREALSELQDTMGEAGIWLASVPRQDYGLEASGVFADLDGELITSIQPFESGPFYSLMKRAFDIVCSAALLLLLSPLFFVLGCMVKLDSKGPIFFKQTRIGKGLRPFRMLKFRSMYIEAPQYSNSPRLSEDPRITKVGKTIRRLSLDELPQLINVFLGDMSLVGPRPEMPFIVEKYGARERLRLQVIPGITGLWQLSADRAFEIHENLAYDLYYIRYKNFFIDMAILVHTFLFAMRGT